MFDFRHRQNQLQGKYIPDELPGSHIDPINQMNGPSVNLRPIWYPFIAWDSFQEDLQSGRVNAYREFDGDVQFTYTEEDREERDEQEAEERRKDFAPVAATSPASLYCCRRRRPRW